MALRYSDGTAFLTYFCVIIDKRTALLHGKLEIFDYT